MKIKVPLNKYLTLKKNIDNSFPFKRQFSVLNFKLRLFFPQLVLEFQFREPVWQISYTYLKVISKR